MTSQAEEEKDLPWDPFWEYILGEKEIEERERKSRGLFRRREGTANGESFLDYFIPGDDESYNSYASASVRESATTNFKRESSYSSKDSRRQRMRNLFRRRSKRDDDDDAEMNAWDVSDQLTNFFDDDDVQNEKDENKKEKTPIKFSLRKQGSSQEKDRGRFWKRSKRQEQNDDVSAFAAVFDPFYEEDDTRNDVASSRNSTQKQSEGDTRESSTSDTFFGIKSKKDKQKQQVEKNKKSNNQSRETAVKDKLATSLAVNVTSSEPTNVVKMEKKENALPTLGEEKDQTQNKQSGAFSLETLVENLIGVSSSEDSDDSYSSADESVDSISQSETTSIVTDEGAQAIVTASLNKKQSEATKSKTYNEVRLKFTPGEITSSNLLPPLDDEEKSIKLLPYVFEDCLTEPGAKHDEAMTKLEKVGESSISPDLIRSGRSAPRSQKGIDCEVSRALISSKLGVGRLVCRSSKEVDEETLFWTMRSGIPIHELTPNELAEILPGIRLIPDNHHGTQDKNSILIGPSNSFEANLPAHLQLPAWSFEIGKGPQSLYEYEYGHGSHMNVVFDEFGENPLSLIRLVQYDTPPEAYKKGTVDYNKVVVQIEV